MSINYVTAVASSLTWLKLQTKTNTKEGLSWPETLPGRQRKSFSHAIEQFHALLLSHPPKDENSFADSYQLRLALKHVAIMQCTKK